MEKSKTKNPGNPGGHFEKKEKEKMIFSTWAKG